MMNMAVSRRTLFSVANITYIQTVNEILTTEDLTSTTAMVLAKEASLIKLTIRDGIGDNGLGSETLNMLEIVEESLEEIEQSLNSNQEVESKIVELILLLDKMLIQTIYRFL